MVVEVSMKNKKGFTLVELIATILLITLSSTIIVINLQGSTGSEDNSLKSKNDKQITDVACNLIDSLNASNVIGMTRDSCKNNNDGCSITLQTLIQNGFIDGYTTYDDTGKTIQDSLNIAETKVNIKWKNASESNGYVEKQCILNAVEKNNSN